MGTKRGEPATREPLGTQLCRGCNVEVAGETAWWDAERRTFVCTRCEITDPCGLFGPMRPVPVAEHSSGEGA
jgi:hypothetical protein